MFEKVLIANRGEIALRIIRACRELGVRTVVAYSEADRDSLAVKLADEAVCIGPPPASKSYLNIPNIISAALVTGCDSIHPGYGFLSENPYFAEICEHCNLAFIGPPAKVIEQMGDKAMARKLMRQAGIPVLPGTEQPLKGLNEAREAAEEIGYPVLLKASFGGGGRGLRVVWDDDELGRSYPIAQAESESNFGKPELYLEKFIQQPRHIEFQILADSAGNSIHLGERDCSIQRRHQKIIEESPSPAISSAMRTEMGLAAVKAATFVGYQNAGTLEFLLDEFGKYYFIEMNTRIQVEHGVTELITGIDLVKWQLMIAAGAPLTISQQDVIITGHSIECRITAEDAEQDFRPTTGTVRSYLPPGGPGVRIDSHLLPGYTLPPYYDSLAAKLLVWGKDREEAVRRLNRALDEFTLEGITTTLPFLRNLVRNSVFKEGKNINTKFVENQMASLIQGK